ncbi:MAG: helix-turn-helix domain-containing protein [Cetobacterium sp.]
MEDLYLEIIKKIRANNLTQEELAEKLKINQSTLSKNLASIKNGKCALQTLSKLCSILNLEIKIQNKSS